MKQSTESPVSVTYSLISPNGFPMLLTLRDDLMGILMTNMALLEESLKTKGFKPQEKKSFGGPKAPPQLNGEKCPKCGADMAISKSTGKPYCSKLCWKNAVPSVTY